MKIKRSYWEYIAFALPLLLALLCVTLVSVGNHQASAPIPMPQEFAGEYSYDGMTWLPLTPQAELSALKGDLLLRGHFLKQTEEGMPLSFYRNHIAVAVSINGEAVYSDDMLHIPQLPVELFASMCSREWVCAAVPAISPEDSVEIRLHNPHRAGNRTAYRDFLDSLCSDPSQGSLLQQNLEPYGKPFRIVGGMLAIAALLLMGAAAAAAVTRIPVGGLLLELGLLTLFAGGFAVFDTIDISYWSSFQSLNTYARLLCLMLAVLFLQRFISRMLSGRLQRLARGAVFFSLALDCLLMLLSAAGFTVIFDTLPFWIASQLLLCPLLLVCCIRELPRCPKENRLPLLAGALLSCSLLLDMAGIGSSLVWRSPCTKLCFLLLFVLYVIAAARNVVRDHRGSLRAESLEKELEDSRIAIMLSQIKPHFLYNVLNTIYHLYGKEPETAQEAVSSFAEYLRCNMLSIEKQEPIPFSEEYRHIQTYLSLEQIRFRGKLDVVYDVDLTDFKLPPLTVEPLVENAVKHGVTKKRGGGTVTISTRRSGDSFIVEVADTGVGFDPERCLDDGKPHVGIRNVRQRLQSMMGGSLSITSSPQGTLARVTIPAKEASSK